MAAVANGKAAIDDEVETAICKDRAVAETDLVNRKATLEDTSKQTPSVLQKALEVLHTEVAALQAEVEQSPPYAVLITEEADAVETLTSLPEAATQLCTGKVTPPPPVNFLSSASPDHHPCHVPATSNAGVNLTSRGFRVALTCTNLAGTWQRNRRRS